MTGTNFRFTDRGSHLKEMREKYLKMCEHTGELYDRIFDDDAPATCYADYYEAKERRLTYGDRIWEEAFYTYGRDWNAANEYVRQYGIETH